MEERSLDVLERSLKRLKQLAPMAISPAAQDAIEAEISEVELALDIAFLVAVRLRAAGVVVKPLENATAERLSALTDSIDHTIEEDAIATASFADVKAFVAAASEVRDIIEGAIMPTTARAG